VTMIIFSILGDMDNTCNISSNIILHNASTLSTGNCKRVFEFKKVFTGIIAAIFKLNVHLF
jgi:hypothetical protein